MCAGAHRDQKEGGRSFGARVIGSFEESDMVGINQTLILKKKSKCS